MDPSPSGERHLRALRTPIVAPFDGKATTASDDTAGLYVTVTGAEGFVQMLDMPALGKTGTVKTGDAMGYVGETELASGTHTHFEWHPGGGPTAASSRRDYDAGANLNDRGWAPAWYRAIRSQSVQSAGDSGPE